MQLSETLINEIVEAEEKVNRNIVSSSGVKRVKYIKIHPKVFRDLIREKLGLKSNENESPSYITHQEILEMKERKFGMHIFFGIPMFIDPKVEKWEIII